jgi:hypothetical protein
MLLIRTYQFALYIIIIFPHFLGPEANLSHEKIECFMFKIILYAHR